MSVIKLKIEEIGSGGELGNIVNYVLDTQTNSNVSNTSYKVDVSGVFDVLDIATNGSSGISMASNEGSSDLDLVFDENDNLSSYAVADGQVEDEENPSEFIWGVVPEDGKYSVKLTFTESKDLRHLLVYGDSVVGQYPVEAIIDGSTTITNIDNMWNIDFGEPSDTHTVEFTKWSLPNYNACLTRIMVSIRYLELGREFVNNFNTLSQTTTSPATVQYGVVANSGKLDINDINDELMGYIEEGIIENSNMKVELYINDNRVQTHTTSDSSYVEEERILRLQLTNGFSKWDKITYVGRPLTSAMYADELLIEVLKTLEYNDKQIEKSLSNLIVFGPNNVTGTIKDYLHTIRIPYPYLKSASYRETIDKFCNLAQLNVYADQDDLPIFVSARPVASVKEIGNAIKVTPAMQISNVSRSIVLKNKYDAVDTYETQVNDKIENDVYISSYSVDNVFDTLEYNTVTNSDKFTGMGYLEEYSVYVGVMFVHGTAKFPKKLNNNLDQILEVSTGLDSKGKPNITHSLTGKKTTINDTKEETTDWTGQIATYGNISYSYYGMAGYTVSVKDQTNLNTVTVTEDETGENYVLDFVVAAYYEGMGKSNVSVSQYKKRATIYKAETLDIYFYGQKRTISFEEIDASSSNVTTARTVASLKNNELRQTKALIGTTPVVENIKNNILLDYKKGVQSGSVDLFAGTFKNSNGEQVISFKEGQIIKPYDIVYFENDKKIDGSQRYWRVTGNNFKYEGEPTNPLEIQEIAKVYDVPKFTVTFPSSVTVYNGNTKITSGSQIEGGTQLKVKMYYTDITLEYLKVNGVDVVNNSYFVLNEDTTITTKYLRTIEIEGRGRPEYRSANGWYDIYENFDYYNSNYEVNDRTYSDFLVEANMYDSNGDYAGYIFTEDKPKKPLDGEIQTINILRYNKGEYDDETGDPITRVIGVVELTRSDIRIKFTTSAYNNILFDYGGIYLDVTFEE